MFWVVLFLDSSINLSPETIPIGISALNLIRTIDFHDQKVTENICEDDIIEVFI